MKHIRQVKRPLRRGIFHTGRHFGIDFARHKAIAFQRTQLLCQHGLGHAVDGAPEFIKAFCAAEDQNL